MMRVAVFGNAGGGKSAIARRLAELTGLPLYVVDMMQFTAGGVEVPEHEFLQAHADLLRRDKWIIDGFGSAALAWERFAAADTLVYVDLLPFDSLRLGNQAPRQRGVRRPKGMAGRQSVVEEHAQQLSGHSALPP